MTTTSLRQHNFFLFFSVELLLVFGFLFLIPFLAHAQFGGTGNVEALQVSIVPDIPEPGERVWANAESFTADINRAQVVWSLNGIPVKSGRGEKAFSFTVSDVGALTTLGISVIGADGVVTERSFSFSPASVDLLWQATSYVPPLYAGKALLPPMGSYRVVAIPHVVQGGATIPVGQLSYTWKRDGTVLGSASGYAKNVLDMTGSKLGRVQRIEVVVEDPSGKTVVKKTLIIPTVEPQIIFYENHPLSGMHFERAIEGSYHPENDEVAIIGYPFFFDVAKPTDPSLAYVWMVGPTKITPSSENQNRITIRRQEGVTSALFRLEVRNAAAVLQSAHASGHLDYTQNTAGSF